MGSHGSGRAPQPALPQPPPVKMEGEQAKAAAENWRKLWRKRSGRASTFITDPVQSGMGDSLLTTYTG